MPQNGSRVIDSGFAILYSPYKKILIKGWSVNIPCVLAIKKDSILGYALTNLIATAENGLVVIESEAESFEGLVEEINSYEADVILLENSCSFAREEALTKLLIVFPKLLVIIASEESNWLRTFRRQDIFLKSSTDLLDAIYSA